MGEIELAIKYLTKRAVSTNPLNKRRMKEYGKVVPLSEVNAVLEMVKDNEFTDLYNLMSKQGHPDFK